MGDAGHPPGAGGAASQPAVRTPAGGAPAPRCQPAGAGAGAGGAHPRGHGRDFLVGRAGLSLHRGGLQATEASGKVLPGPPGEAASPPLLLRQGGEGEGEERRRREEGRGEPFLPSHGGHTGEEDPRLRGDRWCCSACPESHGARCRLMGLVAQVSSIAGGWRGGFFTLPELNYLLAFLHLLFPLWPSLSSSAAGSATVPTMLLTSRGGSKVCQCEL